MSRALWAGVATGALVLGLFSGCGEDTHRMPDLVGLRLDRAEAALAEAGFQDVSSSNVVGMVWVVDSDQWAVVEQTPAGGDTVPLDTEVELGAGPLDDLRTLEALPTGIDLPPEVEEPLREVRAEADAEAEREAAEEAEESAAGPVDPRDVGLPIEYAPDFGNDLYDEPRPRTLRTDLASYLLEVRASDPATADVIAPALRVVPAAWCSLWLPHHNGGELDEWIAEADASAAAMAQALDVGYSSSTTPAVTALMAVARAEAGRRFCPEQAARPGEEVDEAPLGAGAFPTDRGRIALTDQLLDHVWFVNAWGGEDIAIRSDEIRLAYLDLLAQPAQYRYYTWWPVVMDCDHYSKVISDEYRDETVAEILEINRTTSGFEVHDRTDREETAQKHAGFRLDARMGELVRDC